MDSQDWNTRETSIYPELNKMAKFVFDGEDSITEWQSEVEEIIIQMSCATDKQGLPIYLETMPMIKAFTDAVDQIRRCMNNTSGAMLIPGSGGEE